VSLGVVGSALQVGEIEVVPQSSAHFLQQLGQ
jgi:hypothetical protein